MTRYFATAVMLLLLVPALGRSQEAKDESVTTEEYAVYSALLEGLRQSPGDGKELKLFVVNDTTQGPDKMCLPEELARWNENIQTAELKPLLADLLTKNARQYPLRKQLTLSRHYVLLRVGSFSQIFFKSADDSGWDEFYKQYPSSSGYITFSRVGFNKDETKAVIYRETRCGPSCGYGGYLFLKKVNDRWSVATGFSCWQS
jgi:hypothetical protein